MAKQNLEQEQLISEVKNHIAIVRSAPISKIAHVRGLPAPQTASVYAEVMIANMAYDHCIHCLYAQAGCRINSRASRLSCCEAAYADSSQ